MLAFLFSFKPFINLIFLKKKCFENITQWQIVMEQRGQRDVEIFKAILWSCRASVVLLPIFKI